MSSDAAVVAAPTDRCSVAVIVVNWRNAADTLQCLTSLLSASPRPDRLILVDNGSADGSAERFIDWAREKEVPFTVRGRELAPEGDGGGSTWLTLVRLDVNLGFAGGNNVGLSVVEADPSITHFLLLNNDAVVARDYFAQLGSVVSTHPHAGLYIGTIYEMARPERVWYAGGRMHPLRALALHGTQLPSAQDTIPTEFVTGCAMVITRSALERVGMLAECYYPGYMEDVEYSWRVQASGLNLIYAPRAVVYHKGGATFGDRAVSPLTAYHQNRHRLFFVRRNLRGSRRAAAMLYMALTKPGRALIDALQGRPKIASAVLRGTAAGFFASVRDAGSDGFRHADRHAVVG